MAFPTSLPVLYYLHHLYEWTAKLPDGSLDANSSPFFVFANACFRDGEHAGWVTSLVSQRCLKSTDTKAAIAARTPLPYFCFFTRGRNGILINDRDPTTEARIAKLFVKKHNHSMAYID
jgi:hypothetical protein